MVSQMIQGARVLVVDDHRDTLEVVQRILRRAGYHVDVADTCAAATTLLDAGDYDVLLADVVLPDGDGLDLVRRHPAVPAIAATACAYEVDVRASTAAGCVQHLAKPYDCTKLVEAVRRAAARAGSAGRPNVANLLAQNA